AKLHVEFTKSGNTHPYFQETPSLSWRRSRTRQDLFDVNISDDDIATLRQQLTREAEVLELIHSVGLRGRVQLPYDFQAMEPFLDYLPETDGIKGLSDLLYAKIALAVHDGDTDIAVVTIEDTLRLAHALRDDPTMIGRLIGSALAVRGAEGLARLLGCLNLSEEQRLRLDKLLAEVQGGVSYRTVVLAERAMIMTSLEGMSNRNLWGAGSLMDDLGSYTFVYHSLRAIQLDDQTALMELLAYDAETADVFTRELDEESKRRHEEISTEHPRYLGCTLLASTVPVASKAGIRQRQVLSEARLVLRIDQFYRREDELPERLDQVIGEFESAPLNGIPLGLFSQRSPVFQPSDSGFRRPIMFLMFVLPSFARVSFGP
ncbi:MAG: hypothetical protein MPJ50_19225, partial [Pirellulales bacterium]|nr:hypothetical protein [Pirellulales bacterium]